jgi:dipeptidyl aminopeptidase/acylaminoacyl peptidase
MSKKVRYLYAAACVLSAALTIVTTAAAQSALPPLIDREIFFGNPEIASAQISPDGKYIAFRKPYKDTMNLWVKRADEPFERARLITSETKRPIRGYFWSRDGKYILFVNDFGGDENFNVYAVDPAAGPAAGSEVPAARNLTDLKKVRAFIYEVPRAEPDAIYIGLNDRDPKWHDLYKLRISSGERQLIRQNTDRFDGYEFDNAGKLRLATRIPENGDTELLRLDPDGKSTKVYSCTVFETCYPARFHKDNRRVYLVTNKGDVNLIRLVLFDPETGKEEPVESDPMNRVDFGNARFSDVTDEIIYTLYQDDKPRIYFKDKSFEADYKLLKDKLSGKEVSFGSSTRDETMWMVTGWSDTEPGETFLFDRKTKSLTKQYRIREKLPREALAEVRVVRYKSSDGLEIPAYLVLPKGVPAKNLPTLMMPHGGPWGRDTWGYFAYAQFAANRGYAVLMPNFRGSAGFGKQFLDAGNKQWGDKMQDDITYGVKYLVAEGIADPKRVGIWGGSYGGYATLAGITFTPDLYAAAVAEVAPSNLITLLETIPPYWESGRAVFYKRMGDPNTPEVKAQLLRQSPLTHVAKIKTPLLITQGANDPRVNRRESDQIVIALRERNYPVEYLVAPDEGHGYARPVNNMAVIAAAERFLAKHLGGRYQQSMTPEVAERLKVLTVDVKEMSLVKKPAP